MQSQVYFPSHILNATLDRLEQIVTKHDHGCPYDASMLRTRLIEALGEVGGIWPVSVYQDEDDPNGPSVFAVAS